MNNNLYIIIPYFNFYKNAHRIANLIKFLLFAKNSKNFSECKILIAEACIEEPLIDKNAKWKDDNFFFEIDEIKISPQITDLTRKLIDKRYESLNNIFLNIVDNENIFHIKHSIPQKIWVKENLINVTIEKNLPKDWQYFCWIDGDVIFDNENWIEETKNLLNRFDVIQMFSACFNQVTYNKKQYIGSHGYIYAQHKKENNNPILNDMLSDHTGYGWGMNRSFYKKIERLFELNIVGSADSIIARCATQNLSEEQILNSDALNVIYSPNYAKKLFEYYLKFKNCKYSYLNNNLFHLYHGEIIKRQYMARHKILQRHQYDDSFLERSQSSFLYLKNKKLLQEIEAYLINRET